MEARYFTIEKDGERLERVHEDSVKHHEALGWRVVSQDAKNIPSADELDEKAALTYFSGSMLKAIKPASSQAKAFETLGISIVDDGKQRDTEVVATETMEALSKVESEKQRHELAAALFGKSASAILAKLNKDE